MDRPTDVVGHDVIATYRRVWMLSLSQNVVSFQSVVMHYSWLAAFLWMNVMSFDVYRTFSKPSACASFSSGAASTGCCPPSRFTKYSLYAWTLPAILVSASVTFDLCGSEHSQYRPRYAMHNGQQQVCWFNDGQGLLLFFAAPVGLLLMTNVLWFVATAVHIYRSTTASKPAVQGSSLGWLGLNPPPKIS
jgi:hypothetical protein